MAAASACAAQSIEAVLARYGDRLACGSDRNAVPGPQGSTEVPNRNAVTLKRGAVSIK
jgi:hypothetical protein